MIKCTNRQCYGGYVDGAVLLDSSAQLWVLAEHLPNSSLHVVEKRVPCPECNHIGEVNKKVYPMTDLIEQIKAHRVKTMENNPNSFKREIFMKGGNYEMLDCQKFGDWFLCFHEQKGYFWAAFGMGTVCEVSNDNNEMRQAIILAQGNIESNTLLQSAEEEITRLREALDFYTNERNFYIGESGKSTSGDCIKRIRVG